MHILAEIAFQRLRGPLFEYPEKAIRTFEEIWQEASELTPETAADGASSLSAGYEYHTKRLTLTVTARTLQVGRPGQPVLIYLPWYGNRSQRVQSYFDNEVFQDWTIEGIDIFPTPESVRQVLASAEGTQYAYALIMRMLQERITQGQTSGRNVGIAAISYGANIIGAYLALGGPVPEAIVSVVGGSILETTLKSGYQQLSDPRTIAALEVIPGILPLQAPIESLAASRAAAVVNTKDGVVYGQEYIWQHATSLLRLRGMHAMVTRRHHQRIRQFARTHLQALLTTQSTALERR